MGKALYRKYRSKSLREIVGQNHITATLQNALDNNAVSHAYLFTGPRGTGKTSIARILAHEINNLPYESDSTHLDIIEIDAASNRRIDEIRDLRERVHIAPTSAKYKVYIIDEVHMLTKEAFNALLKTLEEPPAHVIFILATTEAHKLPDTIISRTQKHTFKPVELPIVVEHLKTIAKSESIEIDDEALELIAQHGGGSFRDSISLLDQVRHTNERTDRARIETLLGIAPKQFIEEILESISTRDASSLIEQLQAARNNGLQAAQIAKQISHALRQHIIKQDGAVTLAQHEIVSLLHGLLDVSSSHDPFTTLEITMLKICFAGETQIAMTAPKSTPQRQPITKPKTATAKVEPLKKVVTETSKTDITPEPITDVKPKAPKNNGEPFDMNQWQQVLESLKKTHNTLYSVARMAEPTIDNDTLTLAFKFAFHQKRLSDVKNQQIIHDVVEATTGKSVSISCIVDANGNQAPLSEPTPEPAQASASDPVSTISNIFGGAEVLES